MIATSDDWDFDDAEEWPDDADEVGTIECPSCGAEIYEDAPQCPVCGEYVTATTRRVWDGKPTWYVALGILGIVAVTCVLLFW